MDDLKLFYETLRMYEAAEGQPKPALLEESDDLDSVVDALFSSLTS